MSDSKREGKNLVPPIGSRHRQDVVPPIGSRHRQNFLLICTQT
jgi:hypothetical protein